MLRLGLAMAAIAVLFDATGAALAAGFHFNYGQFEILGVVLFVLMGIYAGRTLPFARALVALLIAAVAEATLGWYVAALIGPARPGPEITRTILVAYALFGVLVDFCSGAIGAYFGWRAARSRAKS